MWLCWGRGGAVLGEEWGCAGKGLGWDCFGKGWGWVGTLLEKGVAVLGRRGLFLERGVAVLGRGWDCAGKGVGTVFGKGCGCAGEGGGAVLARTQQKGGGLHSLHSIVTTSNL